MLDVLHPRRCEQPLDPGMVRSHRQAQQHASTRAYNLCACARASVCASWATVADMSLWLPPEGLIQGDANIIVDGVWMAFQPHTDLLQSTEREHRGSVGSRRQQASNAEAAQVTAVTATPIIAASDDDATAAEPSSDPMAQTVDGGSAERVDSPHRALEAARTNNAAAVETTLARLPAPQLPRSIEGVIATLCWGTEELVPPFQLPEYNAKGNACASLHLPSLTGR